MQSTTKYANDFLDIAGLIKIGSRHLVRKSSDWWSSFFINYNLSDSFETSIVKLKLDNSNSPVTH